MKKSFKKILEGYQQFRAQYALGDQSIMKHLSEEGQKPEVMVVACCDSRVDPSVILQSEPGDLFVVRNVANIVPPYEKDEMHHGTSAALEFGIRFLKVKHLILLGHSQCGGIESLLNRSKKKENDFITNWVSQLQTPDLHSNDTNEYAKIALQESFDNCMTFPWIKKAVDQKQLLIHLWFFDIQHGQIFKFCINERKYKPLDHNL